MNFHVAVFSCAEYVYYLKNSVFSGWQIFVNGLIGKEIK